LSRQRDYDVAFYLPSLGRRLALDDHSGGAETQVLLVSRALVQRGLRVCLIVSDVPGAHLPSRVDGVDVVVCQPGFRDGTIIGRLREVAVMRKSVRDVDAEVVVTRCAGPHVGLIGFWTKLALRRFVYSSSHDLDFRYEALFPKLRHRALFRIGIALADTIVVQTQKQAHLCEERFRRTPMLIRSVSEPGELSDREPEAFIWIGRLDAIKKPLEFVRLARTLPDARFWMVPVRSTNSTQGSRLWRVIERAARVLPNFEVVPSCPRSELLPLMERAVAIVSTSESEGMPNVFLEAWSRGIPALALHHDPDGIISRYGLGGFATGRRERFAELALELWDGRAARAECAVRCQAYVRGNHSPEAVSAEWARILQLPERSPRRPIVAEPA